MQIVIATWFHGDDADTSSLFSQVGGDSTSKEFQAIYWRCVLVFLASSIRWNPDCRHALVTNLPDLPAVDGLPVEEWCKRHKVTIIKPVPLSRVTPKGFWDSWKNQFYVYDALDSVGNRFPDADVVMLFDSDCVWLAPHYGLTSVVMTKRAAVYTLPYGPDHVENGVRVADIMPIGRRLLGLDCSCVVSAYHGGDVIACDRDSLHFLLRNVSRLYDENLIAWHSGQPYLKEEAHFLSVLYGILDVAPSTANPFFRRIWTGPNYCDLRPSDEGLDIWHLPNEKRLGLARLYRRAIDDDSWFWKVDQDQFRRLVGRLVGIPRRSPLKHLWARVMNRVERIARQEVW